MSTQLLLDFCHGLGDVCQFTVILKHLARYRPDWGISVRCGRGKHTALIGLCHRVYHDQEPCPPFDTKSRMVISWWENYNRYGDRPNSKVTNCLAEVFGLGWDRDLGRYEIQIPGEKNQKAADYLTSCGCVWQDGRLNAVIIHYEGNTSKEKKNVGHHEAQALCRTVLDVGCVPIILDWDKRSPIPDNKRIFCPGVGKGDIWGEFGSGDAAMIAALVAQSSLFVGVDSGPQKAAGATNTPAIGVWTGHSPVQFFDPCPNFLHLVPENYTEVPPCNEAKVADFFRLNYNFTTYGPGKLADRMCELALRFLGKERRRMGNLIDTSGFWVPSHRPDQSAIIAEDVYWNDAYKTQLRPKKEGVEYVVDLGANIGAFSRLWFERNPQAKIVAVEVCPELIPALQANVGNFAKVVQAACIYSDEELFLLNSFTEEGLSTGGSRVVGRWEWEAETDPQYRHDTGKIDTVTLEQIMRVYEFPRIDVLKLDVEGSEFSILENCDLSKIRTIFIESHGHDRFMDLLGRRFPLEKWDRGHMSQNGDFSNWHLVNRSFNP